MKTVEQALSELPPTVEEIVQKMTKEGIKGKRNNVYYCPLARYLSRETGKEVIVGRNSCKFFGDRDDASKCFHTHAINAFINLVDSGNCPELLEDPTI